MTTIATLKTTNGQQILKGHTTASHPKEIVPISWEGNTDLLKAECLPAWLRGVSEKLDSHTFVRYATEIASSLELHITITHTGTWSTPNNAVSLSASEK